MGVVALSSLPAPLRKAVEATPDGQVSKPVQGPGGWYLFKTADRTPGGIPPFSEVEQKILAGADQAQALRGAGRLAGRRPRQGVGDATLTPAVSPAGTVAILRGDRDYRRSPVRKALILLAVVALLILVVGALNNGTAFDVDYVAGTVTSVSLLWVSAVLAALVFVVGLAAAWFAQAAMTGSRRKLEAELQSTYERLREAEALAARPAPAAEAPVAEVVAATVVAEPEPATVVETGEVTEVAGEAVTVVDGEAVTVVDGDEAATAAATDAGRRRCRGRRPPSRPRSPWPVRRRTRLRRSRKPARAPRPGRRTPPTGPTRPPERDPAASVASGRYTRVVMHS